MNPTLPLIGWDSIKVPSNWEVEGFGVPIYVNHQYEFTDYKAMVADDMELIDRIYQKNWIIDYNGSSSGPQYTPCIPLCLGW
mgnify:CR=1 FL=1